MRYVFFLCFLVLSIAGFSQVYNPIPQYVFRNKLGVGRNTPVDSAAYMNIGPNGGAVAGVVLPRVADTLSISGTKRNGLLIFSLQLNKFAWWDSTAARWTEVGSGSGSSGGEVLLSNGSSTVGDSLLFSTISGDTAYIRNLWFANGLVVENMGDTVLKVNLDSSQVTNIYTADGEIPIGAIRNVFVNNSAFLNINTDYGGGIGLNGPSDSVTANFQVGSTELDSSRYLFLYSRYSPTLDTRYKYFSGGFRVVKNLGDTLYPVLYLLAAGGLYIVDSTDGPSGIHERNRQNFIPFTGVKDTLMYWNPSTGQVQRALASGANIANSNLVITDEERYLGIGPDSSFYISSNDFSTIYFAVSDFSATNTFQIENLSPELNNASFGVQYQRLDSTASIRLASVNSKIYPFDGSVYGNREIQLDTTGVRINGVVYGDVTRYTNTSNHNLNLSVSTHILNDLTGAASRTIALHPKPSGALIRILNQSSDGTNKWSFAGSVVYDKNGTTVTTLDDHTCYELMYLESANSNFGAGWHIIKKY